jgi:hypothetical protein
MTPSNCQGCWDFIYWLVVFKVWKYICSCFCHVIFSNKKIIFYVIVVVNVLHLSLLLCVCILLFPYYKEVICSICNLWIRELSLT